MKPHNSLKSTLRLNIHIQGKKYSISKETKYKLRVKQKTKGNRQCSKRNKKQSINWEEQLTKGRFNWQRRKSILNNKTTSMKSINTFEWNDREMKLLDTLNRAENDGGTVVLRWRRDWRRDREIEGLTAEGLTDCGSSTAKDWGMWVFEMERLTD
jgi:hypothetical protein